MSLGIALLATLAAIAVAGFILYGGRLIVLFTNPRDPTHTPDAHVLRYHLATGQDGSAVIGAVRRAGYHATTEYDMGREDLVILCDGDLEVEREKVRKAIAGAPGRDGGTRDFAIPPVRFLDEPA